MRESKPKVATRPTITASTRKVTRSPWKSEGVRGERSRAGRFLRRYADRWRALDLLLAGIRLQSES
ncbi:hypothetical protein [Nocardioides houyundeii]|uniref:hypothetical protein n=1 Tax=Nocardioides houyundeii TaxID=2045452 RepID=UPI0013B474F7|nr:hypothetical protein [Nocardioides houyundeii]